MKPARTLPSSAAHSQIQTCRATVIAVLSGRRVHLRVDGESTPLSAVVAALGYDAPVVGDEVLALLEDDDAFVIGVLRALRAAPAEGPSPFEARDAEGRLLFRHDPETGSSEVFVPHGDLRFRVAEGHIALEARDGVSIDSDEKIDLRSGTGVEIGAGPRSDEDGACLVMSRDRIGATAPELLVGAGRAQLVAPQAMLVAEHLKTTVTRAQHVARVIETRAHRVVEHTKFSIREVERLAQTKADRVRTVVRTSAQLLAERVVIRSKKDTKIRGEKIYLA